MPQAAPLWANYHLSYIHDKLMYVVHEIQEFRSITTTPDPTHHALQENLIPLARSRTVFSPLPISRLLVQIVQQKHNCSSSLPLSFSNSKAAKFHPQLWIYTSSPYR